MEALKRKGKRRRRITAKQRFAVAVSGYSGTHEISGDSCCSATLPDGRFALAISDGMGKGERAAQESSLAVKAVIRMLQAGLEPDLTLKLLNSVFMIQGGRDCYSTMDLAVLDPASRELLIYKIGAAPTAVRRASVWRSTECTAPSLTGRTEILTAPAMPMGVMEYDRIPCVSTMVRPGDQIIMMTDGIVDAKQDDMDLKWLQRLLARIKSRDMQTVCDLITREAAINYGGREKDDMTVAAFEV